MEKILSALLLSAILLTACGDITGNSGGNGSEKDGEGIVFYDDTVGHDFDGDGTIQADEKDLLDGTNDGAVSGDRYLAAAPVREWHRSYGEFYFSDEEGDIPDLADVPIGNDNNGGVQTVLADYLAETVGDGKENTRSIVEFLNERGDTGMAAQRVTAYRGGGHEDWFLPSIGEMAILFSKQDSVGDILHSSSEYFSSTERDGDEVWGVVFDGSEYEMPDGFINPYIKTALNNAHPIRAFQ